MTEESNYQPWMDSPLVSTLVDYEEDESITINTEKVSWFDVRLEMGETEQEKKEKVEAMREQISLGILQPNGFPVGMAVPNGTYVPGAKPQITPRSGFNFPGAIPLPSKFNPTPVTKNLRNAVDGKTLITGILPRHRKDRCLRRVKRVLEEYRN